TPRVRPWWGKPGTKSFPFIVAEARSSLRVELLAQQLVDDLRVRLALRLLHHLAHEEAEHALLAAAIRLDLCRARIEDAVDERLELGRVRNDRLREDLVTVDRRGHARGERRGDRLACDAFPLPADRHEASGA